MKYVIIIDYAYYTDKIFYKEGEEILYSLDEGVLSARLFMVDKYSERINNRGEITIQLEYYNYI